MSQIKSKPIDDKQLRLWFVATDDYDFLESVKKVQKFLQEDCPMTGEAGEVEDKIDGARHSAILILF